MLRVVVLLEGEPSSQSEVLSTLEQVYIKDLLILTSLPDPAAEKTSPEDDAATTMIHHRDGARFHPDVTHGIQAKEVNLGFIRLENLVSYGL